MYTYDINVFILLIIIYIIVVINFYRAALNADAVYENSVCLSVCPSVCLSVKSVHCDKTEEKSVQILYLSLIHI